MAQTAGRPRSVDTEDRMTAAAVEVYARAGWDGFSIAAVAARAGLGKSSAYLRWQDRVDLLGAALERYGARVQDVDTGSIRSDLVTLGLALHAVFDGPAGAANLRLRVDALVVPDLAALEMVIRDTQVAAARQIVRRGILRGELPAGTSISLILNAVCGGVINHVDASAAVHDEAERRERTERFCGRLVDLVLTGAHAGSRPHMSD